MDHERAAVKRALRESKESYEREAEIRRNRDIQFIDEFKRAILLEGGYVSALGPEPVESQVAISLSNPRQKVQKKQQSSRLLAMKTAFDKEEEVGGNDDDDDDEWDPLQYARSRDSDDEGTSPSGGFPSYREESSSHHRRDIPKSKKKVHDEEDYEDEEPMRPRNRDEERLQLARALRESHQQAAHAGSGRSQAPLSGASIRRSTRRTDEEELVFEEGDPQPLPPPSKGKGPGGKNHARQWV